jgi:hypothetical protein
MMRTTVTSLCPNCGDKAERETYDIGDGPELCCASCEWCWGAKGQPLTLMTYRRVVGDLGYDPLDKLREQRETQACSGE